MRDLATSVRHILLVDSNDAFRQALVKVLGPGYVLRRVAHVQSAMSQLDAKDVEVVLLNLDSPNSGIPAQHPRNLLQAVSERALPLAVIAYGWDSRRETAMEVIRQGALDYIDQPLDVQALKVALDRAYRRTALLRDLAAAQNLIHPPHPEGLLGNSKAMEGINEVIRKVAAVLTTVLITGESGTGKGLVARAIHHVSPRADKPFVVFSPQTLPDTSMENELFGHEEGAFGMRAPSCGGRFEEARGGTILIEDIASLALPLQAKLLRVLQERTLERPGSAAPRPVDVRVICASSRNLEKMVQEGTFREDLYFRISVVKIPMPPLRERGEDIPLLAEYFMRTFASAHNKQVRGLTPGFLSALAGHHWPGNVRELQNVIERSLILTNGSDRLGVDDLPPELRGSAVSGEAIGGSFHQAVRNLKRELVRSALRMHGGNKLRAARELHISRCYLHRLLNQLKIADAARVEEHDGKMA